MFKGLQFTVDLSITYLLHCKCSNSIYCYMEHIKKQLRQLEVRFEDPEEASGFTKASNLTLFDTKISSNAFRLLLILKNYGWKGSIFPNQDTLAKDLGTGERQIRRLLQELKHNGYITWSQRGLGKSNIYTILKKWKNLTPLPANISTSK